MIATLQPPRTEQIMSSMFNEVVGLIRRAGDDTYGVEADFRESFSQCETRLEQQHICYQWLAIYDRRVKVY
jgi:hypothetical protein